MLFFVVQLLVLQSLTFVGSLCCRSMGEEGRRSRAVKQIFVVFFPTLLSLTLRTPSEEFLPLHHSTLLVHSCQQSFAALSYEQDQEINVTKIFGVMEGSIGDICLVCFKLDEVCD